MGCFYSKEVSTPARESVQEQAPTEQTDIDYTLNPQDFISEGDDYTAYLRFYKYDDQTIAASDVLCYDIEIARERLLILEIKISHILRKMRRIRADLRMIQRMELSIVAPTTFGINPKIILEEQLAEKDVELHYYIARADDARRELDVCYTRIMRYWDVAYNNLMRTRALTPAS